MAKGLVVGTYGWPPECPVGTSENGNVEIELGHGKK